jgi:PAS domain S-box-containing protein
MKKKRRKNDPAATNRSLKREIRRRLFIEKELRCREEKFRLVADYTYDWEYWVTPHGNFNYISPSCERITGYSVKEFESSPELLLQITLPADRKLLADHLEEELHSKKICHLDFRIRSKAGKEVWISHFCQPAYDVHNEFVGRRASNRDITNRMKMSQELAESEKRLRLALDASSDGVWDWNLIEDEVYYGQNWHRLLGYTDEDMKTKTLSWDKVMHPDDMERTLKKLEEHIAGQTKRYEIEFRMKRKDGDWQWILSRGKIVEWDEAGRPSRFIGTHTDIGRLKDVEKELNVAYSKLDQKVKERTKELEDANIALKVLLQKRNESRQILEQQILDNVSDLIEPYLAKLKAIARTSDEAVLVDIIESNIKEITSPFSSNLSLNFTKLTPTEVQVVNLIKQGRKTKDIASLLNLSPGTISIHRKNIRKKLGLTNQGINLQSFLSSYSH